MNYVKPSQMSSLPAEKADTQWMETLTTSYPPNISQLVRFARACSELTDFNERIKFGHHVKTPYPGISLPQTYATLTQWRMGLRMQFVTRELSLL